MQRRRFHLGIRNLAELYRPLLDEWRLFDNTGKAPHLVASEKAGVLAVSDVVRLARIEQISNVSLMPKTSGESMVEEAAPFFPDAETRAAMRAMRKAFADAVLENLRFGLPVIQYIDGKVVKVPAEELAPLARRILAANGEPLPEDIAAGRTF